MVGKKKNKVSKKRSATVNSSRRTSTRQQKQKETKAAEDVILNSLNTKKPAEDVILTSLNKKKSTAVLNPSSTPFSPATKENSPTIETNIAIEDALVSPSKPSSTKPREDRLDDNISVASSPVNQNKAPIPHINVDLTSPDKPAKGDPPRYKGAKTTYADIARNSKDTPITDNISNSKNSFLIAKRLHDRPISTLDDDDVIYVKDAKAPTQKTKKKSNARNIIVDLDSDDDDTAAVSNVTAMRRKRFKVNVGIGKVDTGVTMETAPTLIIEKVNMMLRSLSNTHRGLILLPWHLEDHHNVDRSHTFTSFPTDDVDFCERNLFGYNRFVSPGAFVKMRLHLAYPDSVDTVNLLNSCDQLRINREQRFEVAPSDTTSPMSAGTLTGSVKAMMDCPDFYQVFKELFQLSDLGLTWEFPANSDNVKYSSETSKLHIEIGTQDRAKKPEMETYFNSLTSQLTKNLFGTNMTLVPTHDRNLERPAQKLINRHCHLQADFGNNLEMEEVSGFALNNWFESKDQITLHQKLMSLNSITKKTIGSGTKQRTFFGRLFYAIIYNRDTRRASFYFLPANRREARSVALGLPLFIRDEFGIDPTFYCSYDKYMEAKEGLWNALDRSFLTKFEKDDEDRINLMKESLTARPVEEHISKDHARALQTDNEEVNDDDTALTKGSKNPLKLPSKKRPDVSTEVVDAEAASGSVSTMTGSTRTSKVVRATSKAVQIATQEFLKGQAVMQAHLKNKDITIMELMDKLRKLTDIRCETDSEDGSAVSTLGNSVADEIESEDKDASMENETNEEAEAQNDSLEQTQEIDLDDDPGEDDDDSDPADSQDEDMDGSSNGSARSHQTTRSTDEHITSPERKRRNQSNIDYNPGEKSLANAQDRKRRSEHTHEPTNPLEIELPDDDEDEEIDADSNSEDKIENPRSGPVGGKTL